MSLISIIIITYNRVEDTLGLLKDIQVLDASKDLLKEVILVNNASTDDYGLVKEYIRSNQDTPFRYVDAPSNLGVSGGRNLAASLATGELLVFLDDDVVIEDRSFLARIRMAAEQPAGGNRPLGVIGFKVRYYSTRQVQQNAFPHKNYNKYKDQDRFLTSYYVGCAHLFRAGAWKAAGQYPVDFFYGMEEYDMSYRVLDAGYAIGYDASVEIFHKESPQGRAPRADKLGMMWVNKTTVAWRYLPFIYYLTTAIAWSGFYLIRSGFDLSRYFSSWGAVLVIPFRQKRKPVSDSVRAYLRAVEARLWF